MNFLEKVVTNFPGLNNSSQSQASDSGCRDSDSKNQKNNRDRTRTPSPKAFSQFLKSGTKHKPSSGAESSLNENRWSSVGARYRGNFKRRYHPGIRCAYRNCSCNEFIEEEVDEEKLWRIQKIVGEEAAVYVNKKQIATCSRSGCNHGDIWHRETQYTDGGSFHVSHDDSNRLTLKKGPPVVCEQIDADVNLSESQAKNCNPKISEMNTAGNGALTNVNVPMKNASINNTQIESEIIATETETVFEPVATAGSASTNRTKNLPQRSSSSFN
mmetsp:Transcript_10091/g.12605  ORF Transcript_10091/g.12605 Transcript_10091/m.12605 type:complete len:271 (+) Transcript_10091:590-1402(+)|eukprot:CAMPEP_0204827496 /NCGR_PEP_ID=MMETSP1346-20131115/4942_1 /ASSEMBLY_ACC=CAM_ASM_000771 /TAXON_ID=215587 /ORGANISM="Aplanochytrium stocchinoi, Strain GSBS06" /LENGTH=270 /DNA_ID=CAMNT_0051955939 /DNA_START=601 /DNA_END=1413 /DNA_ORIENTATION=-